tara:strand:+ start:942 stop:1811 length:870 start_codon:yes stop_codon:yes gene_type:complete
MSGTGFFDVGQQVYLPKDTLTWANLGSSPYGSWDSYTTWYKNLTSSSTVAFTSAIIDFGRSAVVVPNITLSTAKDGNLTESITLDSSNENIPQFQIEGSDNSDMSSATSVTLTRTSNPDFTSLGAKRYYRVTTTIDAGSNTSPNAISGINIDLNTTTEEEIIESFNTATVDDGSTTARVIPTNNTFTDITFVGITPRTEVSDTVVTGTGTVSLYVASGYVNTGYFVGDASSVSTGSITSVPLARCVSKSTNNFTIQVYLPNNATDTNGTFDFLVKGLPTASINDEGNLE